MSERDFLSISQIQETLGISRNKAYELANSEGFPCLRIGKRIVVPVKQLDRWIEKQVAGKAN